MKETRREHRQLLARALSRDDARKLRLALRQARRDLSHGQIGDRTARFLDGIGLDHSRLVADCDGDAPDRFDDKMIDWRWKPEPDPSARRYAQERTIPVTGDVVRRRWSHHAGRVVRHRRHGCGFSVHVKWEDGRETQEAFRSLVWVGDAT